MAIGKRKNNIVCRLETMFVQMFFFLFPLIPLRIIYFLSDKLALLVYYLLPSHRKRLQKHLNFAFGKEKGKNEKKRIAKDAGKNIVRIFLEVFHANDSCRAKIKDNIDIQGEKFLSSALGKGKGVIIASAHLGNFMLMGMKLAEKGYPFNIVVKFPQNFLPVEMLRQLQKKHQQKIIPAVPRSTCVRTILQCLKRNQIVCIVADENKLKNGIFVDFFGHLAATAPGLAFLSLKTGASILPGFMVRQCNNRYKIIINPPLKFPISGNRDNDIFSITSGFTKVIESYVRQYPGQWFWVNNRWKTRPQEEGERV